MKAYYREIKNEEAIDFLMKNKAWLEGEIIEDCPKWFGAFDKEKELIGVCGMFNFKNTVRIRTFYFASDYRNEKVLNKLLRISTEKNNSRITSFVTPVYFKAFIENGFKVVRKVETNDDYFMEKEIE